MVIKKLKKLSLFMIFAIVFVIIATNPQSRISAYAQETGEIPPDYLTFTAAEAKSSVTFGWLSATLVEYSLDNGNTWLEYPRETKITLENIGDNVKFRGIDVKTSDYPYVGEKELWHFNMTGKIKASGSITSLTDKNGGDSNVVLQNSCYRRCFYNCTSLITPPKLPARNLSMSCYAGMFEGCSSLIEAPELPATIMSDYCYFNMFKYCSSLKTAPKLPATKLASNCYGHMFDASGLTKVPELPATELAEGCYQNMFAGCHYISEASELPATKLAYQCYCEMFAHSNISKLPELPATELAEACYAFMFSYCDKLELKKTKDSTYQVEWKIPTTSTAPDCVKNMFEYCEGVDIDTPKLGATYYQKGHVHTYSTKWKSDSTKHWLECIECGDKKDIEAHTGGKATCSKKAVCTKCGKAYGTLASHKLVTTTTKATPDVDGKIKTKCKVCKKVTKTDIIYAVSDIKPANKKYTYTGKVQKPAVIVKDSKGNIIDKANYNIKYPTGMKKVGKYTITITLKGDKYTGTKNISFVIKPAKTKIKSVKPASKSLIVNWTKKTKEVTGYEIQYSTDKNFKRGTKKVTIKSAKKTNTIINNLKPGKKYYVRIRTYKKVGSKKYYSDWSAKKAVKVKK